MSEKLLIQLRDCFTAGYMMPHFCADCGIKRPLFVGIGDSQAPFLWEIYVQFMYNRNFTAQFALLDSTSKGINYSTLANSLPPVKLIDIIDTDLGEFDRIIVLEPKGMSPGQFNEAVASKNAPPLAKKIIFLDDLLSWSASRAYVATPLLHFMQRHPGVVLINVNSPKLHQSVHNSEHEKFLIGRAARKRPFNVTQLRPMIEAAQKEGKTIKTPYDFLGYTNREVYDLLEVTDQKINTDGSTSLNDNEFLGIRDGKRLTADQPEQYKNRIYFVGNCVYYGFGVPYAKTVESWLQKFLNEKGLPYRVENESQFTSFRRQDTFYILNKLKPVPGDIIFVALGKTQYIPFINFRRILDRPHDYGDVFADSIHINEIGHKILAQRFFDMLLRNNFFDDIRNNYVYGPPHCSAPLRHSARKYFRRGEFFSE